MNSAPIEIRSAPHVQSTKTVETIMRNVVYSLLPICAFYVFQYGISALASIAVVTGICLLTERVFVRTGTQAGRLSDYSAVITGLLLALTLPPGFPLWMGAVAGMVAIALGKALFGGIGFNVFNPALVGRAFVQAAFPTAIATYTPSFLPGRFTEFIPSTLAWPLMIPTDPVAWLKAKNLDALAGATPLAKWKFDGVIANADELLTSLSGHMAVGPSPMLILLCGAYLASRRYMDWRIPLAVLGSAALTAWLLFAFDPARYPNPFFMLFSGGLILGAVYMATDMATSPVTPKGMWVYGAWLAGAPGHPGGRSAPGVRRQFRAGGVRHRRARHGLVDLADLYRTALALPQPDPLDARLHHAVADRDDADPALVRLRQDLSSGRRSHRPGAPRRPWLPRRTRSQRHPARIFRLFRRHRADRGELGRRQGMPMAAGRGRERQGSRPPERDLDPRLGRQPSRRTQGKIPPLPALTAASSRPDRLRQALSL